MTALSIFDMDKTITRAATFGPFLIYAVPRYAPLRVVFTPLVLLTSLGFMLRLVSRARLKEINLSLMLGGDIDAAKLEAACAQDAKRGRGAAVDRFTLLPATGANGGLPFKSFLQQ